MHATVHLNLPCWYSDCHAAVPIYKEHCSAHPYILIQLFSLQENAIAIIYTAILSISLGNKDVQYGRTPSVPAPQSHVYLGAQAEGAEKLCKWST